MDVASGSFIWDLDKEKANIAKHGVDFSTAAKAFVDPLRKVYHDAKHREIEPRFFCIGKVADSVVTVRFTVRNGKIRIFGAGRWRKETEIYETANRS